jgi:RNA polymerase sigma factor (sigma-70 family)
MNATPKASKFENRVFIRASGARFLSDFQFGKQTVVQRLGQQVLRANLAPAFLQTFRASPASYCSVPFPAKAKKKEFSSPPHPKSVVTNQIQNFVERAASLESAGEAARLAGDESSAEQFFRSALGFAINAINGTAPGSRSPDQIENMRLAVHLALRSGEVIQARQLIQQVLAADPAIASTKPWSQFQEIADWPDEWLIAAVRRDPPEVAALDALVSRHWQALFGRCQMLAGNNSAAADLAQEAWCRVLRTRQRLKAGGHFRAYIIAIATNLWRDQLRSASRAGPLAVSRMASLDSLLPNDEEESVSLMDFLPDVRTSQLHERSLLALDIDKALAQLTPLLREVLVSRFIAGESCLEIGRRHGRTEQTVSGWIRAAIRQVKICLAESGDNTLRESDKHE